MGEVVSGIRTSQNKTNPARKLVSPGVSWSEAAYIVDEVK